MHPIFEGICQQIQAASLQVERARYLTLLRTMDWQYEFSDDHRVWTRGLEQRAEIDRLQPIVDPDGALLAKFKPNTHGVI